MIFPASPVSSGRKRKIQRAENGRTMRTLGLDAAEAENKKSGHTRGGGWRTKDDRASHREAIRAMAAVMLKLIAADAHAVGGQSGRGERASRWGPPPPAGCLAGSPVAA
jgi:hypothetical protein